jgi:hypothetical protein
MQMITRTQAGWAGSAGLQADAVSPSPPSSLPIDQRVTRSKARTRKHSILRTALLLLVTALVICFSLIWRAETARVRAIQASLDAPISAIQARFDELGFLPATLDAQSLRTFESYAGYSDRFYAINSGEPAIIATTGSVPLLLRPNGRYVVVFHHGKLHTEWLTTAQYRDAMQNQLDSMHAFEERLRSRPPELP